MKAGLSTVLPGALLGASIWLGIVSASSSASEPGPTLSPDNKEVIDEWSPSSAMLIKRIGGVTLSPSGERLIYFVRTANIQDGKNQWDREVLLKQKETTQTILQDCPSCSQFSWGDDDQTLFALATIDGARGVYKFNLLNEETTRVSPPNISIGWFASSPDATKIAIAYREVEEEPSFRGPWSGTTDPRPWRLLIARQSSKEVIARVTIDGSLGGFDWSPDGGFLVASFNDGPGADDWRKSDLFRIDAQTGEWLQLTDTPSAEWSPYIAPDGKTFAHIATQGKATATLDERLVIRTSATGRELHRFKIPDDRLSLHGWTSDGNALVIDTIARNRNEIGLVDAEDGSYRALTPEGLHARSISLAGNEIAFVGQTSEQPPEVWSLKISEAPIQVTSVQPDISIAIPYTESISWRASDGLEIEGLLTYPINWREGDPPAPLLVRIHGGPAFASVKEFIGGNNFTAHPTAAFAAAGYTVFQPNYRGSAGRGFDFRSANVGEWGRADVADVLAGVDALIDRGIADEKRLGVMGWSYGGYLAAMTVTTDDRFYAASIGAAMSDMSSWWGGTDFKYHVDDYFDGSPLEKPRLYRQRSPALLADKVGDAKILIQHGGADQRVPTEQAQFLYRALLREGKSAELDFYPDMRHSAFDPATRLHILQRNFNWFTEDNAGEAKTDDER